MLITNSFVKICQYFFYKLLINKNQVNRFKMSLYIGLKQVKTYPYNQIPQTPRFSETSPKNTELINQVYAIVEHISKPKQKYNNFDVNDEQNWIIHRQVYILPIGNKTKGGNIIKGQTNTFQPTKSRYSGLAGKSRYFSSQISPIKQLQSNQKMIEFTPISKLNSPQNQLIQHSRIVYQNNNNEIISTKMHQIPLHSQECKIVIKFYYFHSDRQRQYFLNSPKDLKPFHRVLIYKKQMNELIQQLKTKTKDKTGQSRINKVNKSEQEQIYKMSVEKKYDNHSKKVAFSSDNSQFTKLELFTFAIDSVIDSENFVYGAHHVMMQFQVGLERTKQFAGFMKNSLLGHSKVRNSHLSTNERQLQKSNYNFNYNLDFSGHKKRETRTFVTQNQSVPNIYLGKCQTVNIFSILDPAVINKQVVNIVEPDFIQQ